MKWNVVVLHVLQKKNRLSCCNMHIFLHSHAAAAAAAITQEDDKLLDVVEAAAGHRGDSYRDIHWERVSVAFYGRTATQCEAR